MEKKIKTRKQKNNKTKKPTNKNLETKHNTLFIVGYVKIYHYLKNLVTKLDL